MSIFKTHPKWLFVPRADLQSIWGPEVVPTALLCPEFGSLLPKAQIYLTWHSRVDHLGLRSKHGFQGSPCGLREQLFRAKEDFGVLGTIIKWENLKQHSQSQKLKNPGWCKNPASLVNLLLQFSTNTITKIAIPSQMQAGSALGRIAVNTERDCDWPRTQRCHWRPLLQQSPSACGETWSPVPFTGTLSSEELCTTSLILCGFLLWYLIPSSVVTGATDCFVIAKLWSCVIFILKWR